MSYRSCREEDDSRDDPDYHLPQDNKNEEGESDDDVDFDMEGKVKRLDIAPFCRVSLSRMAEIPVGINTRVHNPPPFL